MRIAQKSRTFTVVASEEEEGGYSGQCLELPGAISQGETLEELKVNMEEVIQLVLESLGKDFSPDEKILVTIQKTKESDSDHV